MDGAGFKPPRKNSKATKASAKLCPYPTDGTKTMPSYHVDDTCGDYCVAAKRSLVEILCFQYFARHVVFDTEGDKLRNKRIEDYIAVSIASDVECGNTRN